MSPYEEVPCLKRKLVDETIEEHIGELPYDIRASINETQTKHPFFRFVFVKVDKESGMLRLAIVKKR